MLTSANDFTITVPDVVLSTVTEMNDEKVGYLLAQPTHSFLLCTDEGEAQFTLIVNSGKTNNNNAPISLTTVHLEVLKGVFVARHNEPQFNDPRKLLRLKTTTSTVNMAHQYLEPMTCT